LLLFSHPVYKHTIHAEYVTKITIIYMVFKLTEFKTAEQCNKTMIYETELDKA